MCASCNDIVRVDDCHRSVRCNNDQAGVMNQSKKLFNNPFYRRSNTVPKIEFQASLRCFRQANFVNLCYMR